LFEIPNQLLSIPVIGQNWSICIASATTLLATVLPLKAFEIPSQLLSVPVGESPERVQFPGAGRIAGF
jgi:hypothetical protein